MVLEKYSIVLEKLVGKNIESKYTEAVGNMELVGSGWLFNQIGT